MGEVNGALERGHLHVNPVLFVGRVKEFLAAKNLDDSKLMVVLEDYLVEQQPTARKAGAIAAGAIRFGQDRELFDGKFTVKEIAESFGISASSLNKYHQELLAFYAVAV